MGELPDVPLVQAALGSMDIFLAVAVPISFSQSITSSMNERRFTFNGTFYVLGFLLIFTLSQVRHGTVGNTIADTLTVTQEPLMEEKIAQLVDKAYSDGDIVMKTLQRFELAKHDGPYERCLRTLN